MKNCSLIRSLLSITLLGACASGPGPDALTYEEFAAEAHHDPETDTYVINGDELVDSEQAMRDAYARYLESVAAMAEPGVSSTRQGLIVNRVNGRDDAWDLHQVAGLTYCVSRASFGSRHATVVAAMAAAAAAWEAAATEAVDFVHVVRADESCTNTTGVVFNVRQVQGAPFTARAFFPSTARSDREILIDTTAFGEIAPITLTGILRHELGHALGFRHEHTRPQAGVCFEDSDWRSLTSYDAASVMHYPQCNGTNQGDLVLTPRDRSGARILYPLPAFQTSVQIYDGLSFGLPSPWEPISGDFDGDGRGDYARAGSTGAWVYYGAASGAFTQVFQSYDGLAFGLPSTWQSIAADFDGDGRTDYARLGATGAWVFYGNANRSFTPAFDAYEGLDFGLPSAWQPVTGDFNGDGKRDYARLGATGAWLFLGKANRAFDTRFQDYQGLDFGLPSQYQPIAGDFNGDGRGDYARLAATGAWLFFGTAGGSFTTGFQDYQGLDFGLPSQYQPIAGDFNGDGRTDYARLGDGGAWVFRAAASGSFTTTFQNYQGLDFDLPSQWTPITGDFDGDGRADYARLGDTGAWVFSGRADGGFDVLFQAYPALGFGIPSPWQVVTGKFKGGAKTGYVRLGATASWIFFRR